MTRFLLGALLLVCSPALASKDFAEEAKKRMRLSFDLDEVEQRLNAPAAPSPSAEALQQLGYLGYVATPVRALPLEPNSEMDHVTVFRDRALATRVRTETLRVGAQDLIFEGLPLGLQPDSLHGRVRSGEGRIVGVELVSGAGEVEETERIASIRDQSLELTDELGEVRDRIESLLAQREYLRSTLLVDRGDGVSQPALDQIRGTLTYLGETEKEIATALRVEETRAKALDEDLSPLLIKLDNPNATGMTVKVELEVDEAGPLEVELRYQVFGASWTPSYNARLDAASDQVELEYFGVVTQHTGEDWDDVELELSTANPSVSGALPELRPWFLGRDAYGASTRVVDNIAGGRGHFETGTSSPGAPPAPADALIASTMAADVGGSGAVVFAIQGRRSIAGDGSAQRLPVGTQTFAAKMELSTVPKAAPQVFRRANIRYDGAVPLLPGPIASYVGSDYVGSGYTKAVVPGEPLLLAFGTDDRLKVERQLVSRKQDYVGGRKNTRYTLHFRIQIQNFSGERQTLELLDQIPVAEVDKVTVKLLEITEHLPPGPDDGPGIYRWKLVLPDGARETLEVKFSVTAPTEYAADYVDDAMELLY